MLIMVAPPTVGAAGVIDNNQRAATMMEKNKQPHGPGQISPSFGPLSPRFCSDARCFRRRLQR